jgi:hypothetical protein
MFYDSFHTFFIQCFSVHLPKTLFLVAGTMPPKKHTTRKYPRAPNLQEPKMGEGSSPAVVRQLEFAPNPMPVIKTTTKKDFVQPSTFGDTEVNIGTTKVFPPLEEIYRKIKQDEFPEYTPHNDSTMRSS